MCYVHSNYSTLWRALMLRRDNTRELYLKITSSLELVMYNIKRAASFLISVTC